MPTFPIIDAHVHFWDRREVALSWLDGLAIDRPFGPADFLSDCADTQVEALVFVEADVEPGRHLDEVAYVERLAEAAPRIAAIVAHAPLRSPDVDEDLAQLASRPLVRGVRYLIQGKDAASLCADSAFVAGVRRLAQFGLHFEICILHHQLADAIALVQACPETRFVLDHIAKPGIKAGVREPWWREIAEIATFENVVCKLSGVVTEADHHRWREDELRPYIDRVITVFGPERVMFGSDWPVLRLATSHRRWVEVVDAALVGYSDHERRAVYAETARKVYRPVDRIGLRPTPSR